VITAVLPRRENRISESECMILPTDANSRLLHARRFLRAVLRNPPIAIP
jgi:hypothetical protein